MPKQVSASDAKNSFGGLLDDVAALGRVDVMKHGRLVAVVLSPQAFKDALAAAAVREPHEAWGEKHMIPPELARAAKMLKQPAEFDDE
jgi:prevent-host-death family protein